MGFEPMASSLPRMYSTPELRERFNLRSRIFIDIPELWQDLKISEI
jgi:hypothetical protein